MFSVVRRRTAVVIEFAVTTYGPESREAAELGVALATRKSIESQMIEECPRADLLLCSLAERIELVLIAESPPSVFENHREPNDVRGACRDIEAHFAPLSTPFSDGRKPWVE